MKQKLTILLLVFSFGLSAQTIDTLGAINFPDTAVSTSVYDNNGFVVHTYNAQDSIIVHFKSLSSEAFIDIATYYNPSVCDFVTPVLYWKVYDSNGNLVQPVDTLNTVVTNPYNGTDLKEHDHYLNLDTCQWYKAVAFIEWMKFGNEPCNTSDSVHAMTLFRYYPIGQICNDTVVVDPPVYDSTNCDTINIINWDDSGTSTQQYINLGYGINSTELEGEFCYTTYTNSDRFMVDWTVNYTQDYSITLLDELGDTLQQIDTTALQVINPVNGLPMNTYWCFITEPCSYVTVSIKWTTTANFQGYVAPYKFGHTLDCENLGLGFSTEAPDTFVLYPNPATDIIKLTEPLHLINAKILLFNSIGQTVFSNENYNGLFQQIDISTLENGVYFVSINDGNLNKVAKFLISK